MKIAVTYADGLVYQHFGHAPAFKIYEVQAGEILSEEVLYANGSGHGALAGMLSDLGVDALVCGGIGGGAKIALANAGIRLYGGVTGFCDEAVNALLAGKLLFNPDVRCDHHDHEHGKEGHTCGTHTCGNHGCK